MKQKFKGVRAKNFPLIDYLQSDTELPVSEMEKKMGLTDFVSVIKRVETYPDFENEMAHAIQHVLQGFIGESTKENNLCHIL